MTLPASTSESTALGSLHTRWTQLAPRERTLLAAALTVVGMAGDLATARDAAYAGVDAVVLFMAGAGRVQRVTSCSGGAGLG